MSVVHDPVARIVSRAKIMLLLSHPFFGNMATGMPVIMTGKNDKGEVKHDWCKTAATDGKFLYFNREWVKAHTLQEVVFVVAHEILHAVYDHMNRRQRRDADYYNMAGDYVINATLTEGNVGTMPSEGLLSKRYTSEWTTEAVYDDLLQKQVKIEMPLDQHCDGKGSTIGEKDKNKGKGGDQDDGAGDQDDGSGGAGDQDDDGKGKGKGKGKGLTVSIDSDGPPSYTNDELEEIRQDLTQRALQAVQAAQQSNNAGCIPAGVRRMLKELTEPKLDWRTMLDATIRSQMPCDYTMSKLSRYEVGGGFILPAEDDDYIAEADIWIDTSGSMGDELLREILSEVKGIMTSFGQFNLRVGCFDAKAYKVHEFNERNISEIDEFELEGGGGTMFSVFWKAMADANRVPERLIVATDGYPCDSWGNGYERYCDTMWLIHGPCRAVAPFGLTVYYEDAKKD